MVDSVKNQATYLLLGAGALAAAAYPWAQANIAADFVHHTALAAAIGGLADWWGVTAIFKRPLGVNAPGTDALRKNYTRLTAALTEFISNDLLSASNIMQAVAEENFGRLLAEHFSEQGSLEHFGQAVKPLAEHALSSLNTQQAKQLLQSELPKYIASLQIPDILLNELEKAVANDSFSSLWQLAVQESKAVLQKSEFKALLAGLARAAEDEYKSDHFLRNLFIDDKADALVSVFTQELEKTLDDLKTADSSLRRTIDNWLLAKLEEYRHNIAFISWVNGKLSAFAVQKTVVLKNFWGTQDTDVLHDLLQKKIAQLAQSEAQQKQLDVLLKKLLQQVLIIKHETIYELVAKKLAAYDKNELIAELELRVGDDLQNIRKCGTYIGALLGGILFIIAEIAERLCA